jgi:hypothetical protein
MAVTIVQVVDMIIVLDSLMPAALAVDVVVGNVLSVGRVKTFVPVIPVLDMHVTVMEVVDVVAVFR